MKILRWVLFVIGILFLVSIIICIVRSDYKDFGSGVAATILVWTAYFILLYFSKRGKHKYKGVSSAGLGCMNCGKKVEGRDRLMASQSYAVQAGLTQKARDMEKNQGYMCRDCGNLYCKVCLESFVPDSQKGVVCPGCGGFFDYLP
ncbi:MAG: hypothetical protein JXA04_03000 [Gammaproteobacteria bacterium]|nr:hypothetical protein [Gammaproteobacteria bacterium]